jgi:FkbM family methyltransferase
MKELIIEKFLPKKVKKIVYQRMGDRRSAEQISAADALKFFERRSSDYKQMTSLIAPYVEKNGTIIDVGACIGYFSLSLMEKIGFTGKAYLFEPIPNLARICHETFKNTPYDVTIFNYGLSSVCEERTILIGLDGNIGWNTFEKINDTENMKKITVNVKSFDSLCLNVEPSFIKIDVEGNEYQVLDGMLKSFSQWKKLPPVLCEIGFGNKHPNWGNELATFDRLSKMGYKTYDLHGKPIIIDDIKSTSDILLLCQ